MKKSENGITLIALIITIIILVIMAAVSINAVYNMKIVNYAVNASEGYAKHLEEEKKEDEKVSNVIAEAVEIINSIQNGDKDESDI